MSAEMVADPERIAQLIAHRACCGVEHDPSAGKLHGFCVVCGVPWPCEYAGTPPAGRSDADARVKACGFDNLDDALAHLDAAVGRRPSADTSHGGRGMSLRECMDAEDGGQADVIAACGNSALAHLSNALDDLDSSPDQRPVPLVREAMDDVRAIFGAIGRTPA